MTQQQIGEAVAAMSPEQMAALQNALGAVGLTTATPTAGVESPRAVTADAQAKGRKATGSRSARKPKHTYGNAPVGSNAVDTHARRLEILKARIPGIELVAAVFSVGKNASKGFETTLSACVNIPFTYIEFPQGKGTVIGAMSGQEIWSTLAGLGYGFTRQQRNGKTYCFWGCDSAGKPLSRRAGFKAQGVAAAMADEK